ncbi:pilus assembly protein [Methylobacterium oxalidis]|uniref:Uncharacterized protein n=1 Tax=Methylobacterium oxalidis TaxID=944322 RepID=A0A512J8W3_9HYPH|nr:pilus assembly protein TadG-related protein [Methylobacterium oxalidis]GEP06398.1 hypothetical protein MOX02_44360 [Methylobacterium oxalidis]GJE32314.1 hypothetical protein LDDCCGHA_2500 [Methylobacterium oxalidis]GLS63096.1 hypothetical protein GCM10007888_14770 [Methylobacterium oxalidis]
MFEPGERCAPAVDIARRVRDGAARFGRDRGANVAILVGFAALPMIGLCGAGVEYARGVAVQSRLNAAADAAAIAAIRAAADYAAQNAGSQSGTALAGGIASAGQAQAAKAFAANAGWALRSVPVTPVVSVDRAGQTFTATVRYAASYPSTFAKLFGIEAMRVGGSAASSVTAASYTDFYLLLDTSGSMGFPTKSEDQARFAAANPDIQDAKGKNCAFACHFPGFRGYDLSVEMGIKLRIDSVGEAVQQFLTTAKQSRSLPNQYRVGLYPFVSYLATAGDVTSNLDSLQGPAGNLKAYMDVGDSSKPQGSGGTHFENVVPTINDRIQRLGDGISANTPKVSVFLITDGMDNNQYWYNNYGWTGSQSRLLDASLCNPLKSRGITISVLYIPYMPLTTPFNDNVGYENVRVNALIPDVPRTLQACASDGRFHTASSPAEITAALQKMFLQEAQPTRLTQ